MLRLVVRTMLDLLFVPFFVVVDPLVTDEQPQEEAHSKTQRTPPTIRREPVCTRRPREGRKLYVCWRHPP